MDRRLVSMSALPLSILLSVAVWAQAGSPGDGGVAPAAAATVRTPGTPGAAGTPGTFLSNPQNPPGVSSSPAANSDSGQDSHSTLKSKKHKAKPSQSSAPATDTSGNSPVAPPK
jgi:hypothetical protein